MEGIAGKIRETTYGCSNRNCSGNTRNSDLLPLLSGHLVEANQNVNELRQQIETLTQENDALKLENEELNEKVSILSDTVNSKVKEEEEREAEIAQAYVPTGFH